MQRTYEAILRLYPQEHRAIFAREMLDNMNEAAAAYRARQPVSVVCFWCRELSGVLFGALFEWKAKWTSRQAYLRELSAGEDRADLPANIAETERQLQRVLRLMEHAIANHDFPGARLYCYKEQLTRIHLNQLLSSHHAVGQD